MIADEEEYLNIVDQLLQHPTRNVNWRNINGKTPLVSSLESKRPMIALKLIEHGASVTSLDEMRISATALHLAAKNGHSDVVEELLKHGADPNVQDEKGNTPLHLVCIFIQEDIGDNAEEYSEIVDHLLQHPAIDVNIRNGNHDDPLALSLKYKRPAIALKLIELGASVSNPDETGRLATPLHPAARNGYAGVVEELLKHGADPNVQDEDGNTPLHLVCQFMQNDMGAEDEDAVEEYLNIADQLLQHPAINVDIKNNEENTPLALSFANNKSVIAQRNLIQKLIAHNASVNDIDMRGKSALHLLAMNFSDHFENQKDLLDEILEHNDIDINQQDKKGWTALHFACSLCPSTAVPQLIQHLLAMGARADMYSGKNTTVLLSLCGQIDDDDDEYDHDSSFSKDDADTSVDLLLKANKDMLNLPADRGWTPLQMAICSGQFNIALKLLDYEEINIHAKNVDCTVLHVACILLKKGPLMLGIIKKLIAKGADLNDRCTNGTTPVHYAFRAWGRIGDKNYPWDIMKHLLDLNGDHLHALNNEGLSPLMYAAKSDVQLNSLFQILTYTGGTILDCTWSQGKDDNGPK